VKAKTKAIFSTLLCILSRFELPTFKWIEPLRIALFGIFGVTMALATQADVTVASWGGAYGMSQQKAYADTWTAGEASFTYYNGGLDEVRSQVASGNIQWDILDVFSREARIGCEEGLFEELARDVFKQASDGTPMDEDIMVTVPNDCVVPQIFWSYVPFYQKGTFQSKGRLPPKTIADFFDVGNFPGRRAVQSWPNALIEMALMADNVPAADVYNVMNTPEGIDRAFAKLDTIKDQVIFWSLGHKPIELVKSGKAAMAIAYNGRIGAAILFEGNDFVVNWDGQVLQEEWLVVLKGTRNFDEALAFLIHASAPEQQANQAKWINYGPMRLSALDIIDAGEPWFHTGVNILPHLPTTSDALVNAVFTNFEWWAKNGRAISKRFQGWMRSIEANDYN